MIANIDVSRETIERLEHFQSLVLKWTNKINLIARGTQAEVWDRHIVDSAQVWLAAPAEWTKWVDIGSGGGFPALVLAIIAKEKHPDGAFTLIESDQRKCAFLRTVIRELDLNATVKSERIEQADPENADILSARALASLDILLGFCERHMSSDGTALFQKGRKVQEEIAEAEQKWRFDYDLRTSITDAESSLVVVKGIARV